MITITSFKWVPPFAQGLSRDLRIRWALEEASLPYRVRQIVPDDQSMPEHRAKQPFGQIPVYEEDDLVLFESGAILHHIANRTKNLLPTNEHHRARAVSWLFAALNTIEPTVERIAEIDLFHSTEDWALQRRPDCEKAVMQRLEDLAAALGDKDYLEEAFSIGDLMMATVLRILRHTDLVTAEPTLNGYVERCTARPAFERAHRDHMQAFAS